MKTMLGTALLLAARPLPAETAARCGAGVVVQDDGSKIVDKRPEIAELLKELAGHAKKKGEEDEAAATVVRRLKREFEGCGPSDRASIVKEIDRCLKLKRKPLEKGKPDNRLHLACATALGIMGPESVKPLSRWVGHRSVKENLALRCELIGALGVTRDPKAVDPVLEVLQEPGLEVNVAAAKALGSFGELRSKERKEIFGELLRNLLSEESLFGTNPTSQEARERWDAVRDATVPSLIAITGHTEHDHREWQGWWNDNKKRDWDEDREGG